MGKKISRKTKNFIYTQVNSKKKNHRIFTLKKQTNKNLTRSFIYRILSNDAFNYIFFVVV